MSNDETETKSSLQRNIVTSFYRRNDLTSKRGEDAFTIIELLVVIAIIIVLAGLILSTTGYVQKKAARSRAETEIAAMSAACESYKADNGVYPNDSDTNALDPITSGNPLSYETASLYLFTQLSGLTASQTPTPGAKSYFTFKSQMLGGVSSSSNTVTYIRDPFGNSYGYSTAKASTPSGTAGYNPTFDLWSTAGTTTGSVLDKAQWIKNW